MPIADHLGFGCAALSSFSFERQALRILETAWENGITHFDTAPLYGRGYSEKILGKFLKGRRHAITITTKFGLGAAAGGTLPAVIAMPLNSIKKKLTRKEVLSAEFQPPKPLSHRIIDRNEVQRSFEQSISNLQTDHIDYFFLHEGMPSFLTEEAKKYLQDLKMNGSIKKTGIASAYINFTGNKDAFADWDVLQYEQSLLHPSEMVFKNHPEKMHIQHSVMAPLRFKKRKITSEEIAGLLLAKAVKKNPSGKILFSSKKKINIETNVRAAASFEKLDAEEIDKLISNAFY